MAGAADISTILSQAGRIEKINQNPFVQSDVTKQILTEEEARERLRKNREVNEAKKGQEIAAKDRERSRKNLEKRQKSKDQDKNAAEQENQPDGVKHIIDVVV
ncbi:MAG TPA: hypothetical protein ENN05_05695 [Deltaproteobacteria bacterium]|nr:hypothetical protein [Deltaproteobacteria bacterium]